MAVNSDTTAGFMMGRVLPKYLGALALGNLCVSAPAAAFVMGLLITGQLTWSLVVSDPSWSLQFLLFPPPPTHTLYSRLSINLCAVTTGVGNPTLKAVISFACSVSGLRFTGLWGEGSIFSGAFPWRNYVFSKFPMLFLLYFQLVDCWVGTYLI